MNDNIDTKPIEQTETTEQNPPVYPPPNQISLIDIVNVVSDRVEPIVKLITTLAEKNIAAKESAAKFKIRMSWVAVFVLVIVVGVSALMTWIGKLDGSTFGFLLGLVIGYALTFIRDTLQPKQE
jgi:hypothetical protein